MSATNITNNLLKYYIQFLETSFKKQKTPKRKFKWSDSYIKLNNWLEELSSHVFSKLIHSKNSDTVAVRIQKWKWSIKSDKNLIDKIIGNLDQYFDKNWVRIESYSVIQELGKVEGLSDSEIDRLSNYVDYSKFFEYFEGSSYELALNDLRYSHFDDEGKILIWKINYYIQDEEWNIEVTDQTTEFHPVVNYIFSEAWDVITESERTVLQYLKEKEKIIELLKWYQDHDLFDVIQDIDRDSKYNDKSWVYFNFVEIRVKNLDTKKIESFPLFFAECDLSYNVEWTKSFYDIIFSQWININRKLVRYLTQKVDGAMDRTIAPSERRLEFWEWLRKSLNENLTRLLDKLHISKSISLNEDLSIQEIEDNKAISSYQSLRSVPIMHGIKINNICSFSVDEKEFVLIDLDDLSDIEKEKIWKYITSAIDNILNKNPKSFDIETDVNASDFSDKLSYISPLPLNEQQLQILKALDTEWCNNIVVEWPPGTWKSHSIVAMLQHCIQNNKKVLFVSDKKEALDVVEEKINQVFEWDLPSPIVRIGWKRWWSNFNKIFSPTYINKAKFVRDNLKSDGEKNILKNIKDWIVNSLKDEVRLINEKIVWNYDDIKFYLDNEVNYNELIQSIADKKEIDLKDFEVYLTFLSNIKSINYGSLRSFPLHDLDNRKIDNQIESITEIWKKLTSIKDWTKPILSIEEVFKKNYDLLEEFESDRKLYDIKLWTKILELVNNKYDYLEKKWIDDVTEYFQYVNSLKKILDEINLNSLNYLDLRDFKNHETIDKADELLSEYLSNYKSFFGLWSTFKKKKLTELIRKLNKLLPNTSFRKLSSEDIEVILEDELFLINKLHSLLKEKKLSVSESTDEINFIIKNDIDLSFLYKKDQQLDLAYFKKYNIDSIKEYVKLGPVMEIVKHIKNLINLDYDFDRILEDSYIDFNIEKVMIENISKIKEMNLKDYQDNIEQMTEILQSTQKHLIHLRDNSTALDQKVITMLNKKYSSSFDLLWFDEKDVLSFDKELWISSEMVSDLLRYLTIKNELKKVYDFYEDNISYYEEKKNLESKSSTMLFNDVLTRFLAYYNSHKNDTQVLRKLFQWKIDISDNNEDILNLLQDFLMTVWVVIVNIRDIFQYFPLKKDLFDVIIIDEASQVSIWQAFMLLPLAKKVVVLWDRKQYPNIIALHSDKKIDDYYFEEIRSLGRNDLEKDKLDVFRVRNSILDYMKSLNNFEVMLRYHFRSYADLISFSNKTYYEWQLIVPKIRTKKVEEIIKFDNISSWQSIWVFKNTNEKEWQYVLGILEKLKESNYSWSIWVLTPFRNQQKYIHTLVFESDLREWFYEKRNWIVATFDTCQWQEKDYIIYSMVTSWNGSWAWSWNLNTIFPVAFSSNDSDIKLKEARLNVWFSRAKDTIHFVLSTDVERIPWTIWVALKHYKSLLNKPTSEGDSFDSPMEKNLVKRIEETDFYKNHSSDFIIIPQFEIWEYLKQINNADIPSYRVDLLCVMKKWWAEKIFIIEYDWYEFHFKWGDTWKYWLNHVEKDIERQKIIEYYWYQFLRYNKFNIWDDPIARINKDLKSVYESIVYVKPIEISFDELIDDPIEEAYPEKKDDINSVSNWTERIQKIDTATRRIENPERLEEKRNLFDLGYTQNGLDPKTNLKNKVLSYPKHFELSRVIKDVSKWIIVNNLIDYNSHQELDLLDKIKATNFYKRYKSDFHIIPQFPIWLYLNKKYWDNMPPYNIDFIFTYRVSWEPKIIAVEYDWHEFHKNRRWEDAIRQRRIEKYWIIFVRFDKNNSKWAYDVDVELSSLLPSTNLINDIYWDTLK